jgi:carbamoyltransferase
MTRCYSDKLIGLLGEPRASDAPYTDHVYDVAASLQVWFEETVLTLMRTLQRQTGERALCYAGGVALNSAVNGKILDQTDFKDVFIQPAAGDNGTSVGAAYYVWSSRLGRKRSFHMDHAYTGPAYSDAEIRAALDAAALTVSRDGIDVQRLDDDALVPLIARHVADGRIVGLHQGRMEFGPRALGNRSIIVDPRRPEMKDTLNSRIKHREPFRPFAPSILEEYVDEYFESSYPSPAMLMVYKVRPEMRSVIPAVTHVDGTGRLQTVSRRTNPRYWAIIDAFRHLTGVPVVLNTSFNENEPIVCSPREALDCFQRTRMDVLVLGQWCIQRTQGSVIAERAPTAVERAG